MKGKLKLWEFIHSSSSLQTHKGGKNLIWSRFLFLLLLDLLCSGYSHLPGTRLHLFPPVLRVFSPYIWEGISQPLVLSNSRPCIKGEEMESPASPSGLQREVERVEFSHDYDTPLSLSSTINLIIRIIIAKFFASSHHCPIPFSDGHYLRIWGGPWTQYPSTRVLPKPKLSLTLYTSSRYNPASEETRVYEINRRTSASYEEQLKSKSKSGFMAIGKELSCSKWKWCFCFCFLKDLLLLSL